MSETPPPWAFVPFKPKDTPRDVWTAYHAFRRTRRDEAYPDDPLSPDDVTEARMQHEDPFAEEDNALVLDGGRVVASFYSGWAKPGSPGYDSNRRFIWAGGHVLEPFRRRGIATAWFRRVLATMRAHDHTTLNLWSAWPDGHAFVRWLGAEEKSVGSENRLDLGEVDWGMVDAWVADGARKSPATRAALYPHRLPEPLWAAFCTSASAMLNTMPFDDLDHGEIVMTPEGLTDLYKRWDAQGESHHTILAFEPDGSISAITDVNYDPVHPDRIHQMFTGVRPDCRGRGLGKLVKARMLRYLRATYPDARWVITGNANSNDPMLAINRQLGFKAHRTGSSYQIARDALEARLAAV